MMGHATKWWWRSVGNRVVLPFEWIVLLVARIVRVAFVEEEGKIGISV